MMMSGLTSRIRLTSANFISKLKSTVPDSKLKNDTSSTPNTSAAFLI